MSYTNHPLLTTSVDFVGSTPVSGYAAACSDSGTVTVGTEFAVTVDISAANPTAGQFILLVMYVLNGRIGTSSRFRPPTGWMKLYGDGFGSGATVAMQKNTCVMGKFFESGDSTSFSVQTISQGGDNRVCYRAYALSNISRMQPCDYPNSHDGEYWKMTGALYGVNAWYTPRLKAHGDQAVTHVNWWAKPDTTFAETDAPADWSDEANLLKAPSAIIWRHDISYGAYAASTLQYHEADWILFSPKFQNANLAADSRDPLVGDWTTGGGWTRSNLELSESASGTYMNVSDAWQGGAGDSPKSISTSFSATAGDRISARMILRQQKGVSDTGSYSWATWLKAPSGTHYVMGLDHQGAEIVPVDRTDAEPDHYTSYGTSYNGVPNKQCYVMNVVHDADETGTWQWGAWALKEWTDPQYSWDAGGTYPTVYARGQLFVAGAVAVNRVADFIETDSVGGNTYIVDNLQAGFMWHMFDSAWTTPYYPTGGLSQPDNRGSVMAATFARSTVATLNPMELHGWFEFVFTGGGLQGDRLGSQAYTAHMASDQDHSNTIATDRIVLPYYRTSQDAVSNTVGKYYAEVTVKSGFTSSDNAIFLATSGWSYGDSPNRIFSSNAEKGIIAYVPTAGGATGGTYGGGGNIASSLTAANATDDVIGVALDYENAELSFYKNGTLITTVDLAMGNPLDYDAAQCCYKLGCRQPSWGGDAALFDFNLTGPFAYTKPTGFTAWDWYNEVA